MITRDPDQVLGRCTMGECKKVLSAENIIVHRNGGLGSYTFRREHESIRGTLISSVGIVQVHAWRWLNQHPTHPQVRDLTQYILFTTVVDGEVVCGGERRTYQHIIETERGVARVARRWLRNVTEARP